MPIYRLTADYVFGTLSADAAISDTTISSTAFTALGTAYTTAQILPLVLHDPSLGVREVVWATNHNSGSNQVTIVRGKEGTGARAWPSGTQVVAAPTAARDGLGTTNSASHPADAHVGYRGLDTDTGRVVENTYSAGFQPSVGVANPLEIGKNRSNALPPNTATMIVRAGQITLTMDSAGKMYPTFTTPFPNGCHVVMISPGAGQVGPFSVVAETAAGFTVQAWQIVNFAGGAVPGTSGSACTINYVAFGY